MRAFARCARLLGGCERRNDGEPSQAPNFSCSRDSMRGARARAATTHDSRVYDFCATHKSTPDANCPGRMSRLFIVAIGMLVCLAQLADAEVYTNSFLVRMREPAEKHVADNVAARNGFVNLGSVCTSKLKKKKKTNTCHKIKFFFFFKKLIVYDKHMKIPNIYLFFFSKFKFFLIKRIV